MSYFHYCIHLSLQFLFRIILLSVIVLAIPESKNVEHQSTIRSLFDMEPKDFTSFHDIKSKNLRSNERIDDLKTDDLHPNQEHHSKPRPKIPTTREEILKDKEERSERIKMRRENARSQIRKMIENPEQYASKNTEHISSQKIQDMYEKAIQSDPNLEKPENEWLTRLLRQRDHKTMLEPYQLVNLADPSAYYSPWAQAYRMLGGFISCDTYNAEYQVYAYNDSTCQRWVMWAAYINPDYQGYGRGEYFGYGSQTDDYYYLKTHYGDHGGNMNNQNKNKNGKHSYINEEYYQAPISSLDCHSPDTNWKLLGVYRQDFYEFFEQITKHLWGYDDYEYNVAKSGLEYFGDAACNVVGYDEIGIEVYGAPRPIEGGLVTMGIYYDSLCLVPLESDYLTYDYFLYGNTGITYFEDDYYKMANAYAATQEYTMTLFNEVFNEFRYCTLCMDYPSYQDGYFIGDYGVDDDDLINQCWKFYSHDTYQCQSDCIALGDAQQTINYFDYGGKRYGTAWEGSSGDGKKQHYDAVKKEYSYDAGKITEDRQKANLYFLLNAMLATVAFFAYRFNQSMIDPSIDDSNESFLSKKDKKKDNQRIGERNKSDGGIWGRNRSSEPKKHQEIGAKRSQSVTKSGKKSSEEWMLPSFSMPNLPDIPVPEMPTLESLTQATKKPLEVSTRRPHSEVNASPEAVSYREPSIKVSTRRPHSEVSASPEAISYIEPSPEALSASEFTQNRQRSDISSKRVRSEISKNKSKNEASSSRPPSSEMKRPESSSRKSITNLSRIQRESYYNAAVSKGSEKEKAKVLVASSDSPATQKPKIFVKIGASTSHAAKNRSLATIREKK